MSAHIRIKCDRCGMLSNENAGTIHGLRPLNGWTNGYINEPYAGKRADFCPKCSKSMREQYSTVCTGTEHNGH